MQPEGLLEHITFSALSFWHLYVLLTPVYLHVCRLSTSPTSVQVYLKPFAERGKKLCRELRISFRLSCILTPVLSSDTCSFSSLQTLYFSHLCACLFVAVGKLQNDPQRWIDQTNYDDQGTAAPLSDSPTIDLYIASLYFQMVSLSTVSPRRGLF